MKLNKIWITISIAAIVYFVVRFLYFRPTYQVGEPAPLFSAILADGSSFDLERLQGKYVLLDFWGSWCGPCIKDKPVLKGLYQRYNTASFKDASGFEIVSIAVEQSDTRWRAALNRYAPVWPLQILDKVSNLRFFDGELTRQFGVKRLPSSLLLDPEGKIIETNLKLEEIDPILNSQLTE